MPNIDQNLFLAGLLSLTSLSVLAKDYGGAAPCDLLTEQLVREHYDVSADTAIEQQDKSESRFPNCAYRWRVMSEADEQEADARNQELLKQNLAAGRPPGEGINFNIPTHSQVRLTAATFDDPEKAQSALDGAMTFMIGRDEKAGREPTPWDPVEGIGDQAYYHGTQLSFAWENLLIHLDSSPRERAEALASAVIQAADD